MMPFEASEHSLWVSKYSCRWRAVMERAPGPMEVKSENRACMGTTESRRLIETDVSFEVGPYGILFLPLLLYQLWVLESVSSLFLTSTAACVEWRIKHIFHDYRKEGLVRPWLFLYLYYLFVHLFTYLLSSVPHPAFGLPGMAGSWGLLAVFSCSSARLTSRCHRRMRGEEGETHAGIRSLTQRHPTVALLSYSVLPFDSPTVCGFFTQPPANGLVTSPSLSRVEVNTRLAHLGYILLWVTSSMSSHPQIPCLISPLSVQCLLVYLFSLIRLLHYMPQA